MTQFKARATTIIIIILALIIVVGGGYIFLQNRSQKVTVETTTTTIPTTTVEEPITAEESTTVKESTTTEEPISTSKKVTISTTTEPKTTTTIQATPAIFDVKIISATCKWSVKTGASGNPIDCLRAIVTGTATGPVGARLELPILIWSDNKIDCGAWTHYSGAFITVGDTCRRKVGQPETTTWTVDTGGDDCPLKYGFNNNRTYNVKIYDNDEIYEKKKDTINYLCQ